jgi:hypothetical protein
MSFQNLVSQIKEKSLADYDVKCQSNCVYALIVTVIKTKSKCGGETPVIMLISTALLLDSNIRNSVCTPAKLPCRRVEVGYEKFQILICANVNHNDKTIKVKLHPIFVK